MGDTYTGLTGMEENSDKTYQLKDCVLTRGEFCLEPKMKEYGLLDSMQDTEDFLLANPDIIQGPTALSLLEWCKAISDDPDVFEKVTRQCIYIIYLYDLSRQLEIDPVQCVTPFFAKINEPLFRERFEKEIMAYRSKLRALTFEEVLDEVLITTPEVESSSPSCSSPSSSDDGDGPWDPIEVYDSLPHQIKECLDDEDLDALEHEFSELPQHQAKHYFLQLIRSGLLLPIETERVVEVRDAEEVVTSSNDSDIRFDTESKSSDDIYNELLENLEDEDIAHFGDEVDHEEQEDDIRSFDSHDKDFYEENK